MKKHLKKGLFILISFVFLFLTCNTYIFAKDIEIHATSNKGDVFFQTYVGRLTEEGKEIERLGKLNKIDETHNGNYGIAYGSDMDKDTWDPGIIRSSTYIIHNKPFTVYQQCNWSDMDALGYIKSYTPSITKGGYTKAIGENNNVNYIEFARLERGSAVIKLADREYVNVSYNKFPKSYIKKIKENLNAYRANNNGNEYMFYLSEPTAFYDSRDGKIKVSKRKIWVENGGNLNLENYSVGYLKLRQIDSSMIDWFGLMGNENDEPQSIVNMYDNKLFLPKNVVNTNSKVYVRHIDEKGNDIGHNDSEVLDRGGSGNLEELKNNKFSSNNKHSSVYPEYYEVDSGDKLIVSRYLTIVDRAKYYELTGVKVSTSTSYEQAHKNLSKAKSNIKDTVNITAGDTSKVTVIEFKYKKVNIPPDDPDNPDGGGNTPGSGIKTVSDGSKTDDCQMQYTPTNENITPYLIANKVKFITLKYQYKIEGKVLKYKAKNFDVNKLISGNISNNSGDVGKIFGGANDKWTLLEGNSTKEFTAKNVDSINAELEKYKEVKKFPSKSDLKTVAEKKTEKNDFETGYKVPENRYNGLRIPKITANYQKYNVLTKSYSGSKISTNTKNESKVIVYNPIKVEKVRVESSGIVDHSVGTNNTSVIQKNADFTLKISEPTGDAYKNHKYTEYIDKYYLIFDINVVKTNDTNYEKLYSFTSGGQIQEITKNVGEEIPYGTVIILSKNTKEFKAKAGNTVSGNINQNSTNENTSDTRKISLIASSNNMPIENNNWLKQKVLNRESKNLITSANEYTYIGLKNNDSFKVNINGQYETFPVRRNYCERGINYANYKVHDARAYSNLTMYNDAYYFAKSDNEVTNLGRIYDFKVTDCSDIDFKSVFRKNEQGVNDLTGIEYFSGVKKYSIYSSDVNTLEDREGLTISSSTAAKTILPLGPYKNTNISYVNAPKMGYRISFDLKTSGFFDKSKEDLNDANSPKKEVRITPKYYYISKDGKTYKPNINLYYKNSSGKYTKFVGSNYTIYFKPNDGYRTKSNSGVTSNLDTMSSQLEPLTVGSSDYFVLSSKMMSSSDNNFIQSWYGEFKLPNSTIAVEGSNVSKPLTDGYVGVKFEIVSCESSNGRENKISYNSNDKKADPNTNTTQWDYEGYLGFSTPGKKADDLSIQLEKGTWTVNDTNSNAKYGDVKGTVALFDLDNRAANDFD